jgi:hypothetical protein
VLTNSILIIFSLLIFLISFSTAKAVSIIPTNRKELEVNELTMLFNIPEDDWVGTLINPNIPDGISKMFTFFSDYFYDYFYLLLFFFIFFFKKIELYFLV